MTCSELNRNPSVLWRRLFQAATAAAALFIAILTLLGYALSSARLYTLGFASSPTLTAMAPSTAICIALLALSVIVSAARRIR